MYNSSKDYPEYRINAHGHLLPSAREFPVWMKDKGILWISDDHQWMCSDGWRRPVTDPSFFLQDKLAWMEEYNVDHEVILTLSQLYTNGMPRDLALDVCRFQNDYNAEIQAEHPEKFTSGFVLPVAHQGDALRELQRCIDTLGLELLCLPTHYMTADGQWRSTVHHELHELWEEVNRRSLAVQIHPYDAHRMVQLEDELWRFHLIWMCAQTADAYHSYTCLDFPSRYPSVRACFAHGNQFGQINLGRRRQGYLGRPDLFSEAVDPNKHVGSSAIFFDTLVHDPLSLSLMMERQGVSQIVAGLDDPYPLGEMLLDGHSYPGKMLDDAVVQGRLESEQRSAIWFDNVLRWLAGGEQDSMMARLGL